MLEMFRSLHRDKDAIIEENKVILQERYEQAKATGELVRQAKARVGTPPVPDWWDGGCCPGAPFRS